MNQETNTEIETLLAGFAPSDEELKRLVGMIVAGFDVTILKILDESVERGVTPEGRFRELLSAGGQQKLCDAIGDSYSLIFSHIARASIGRAKSVDEFRSMSSKISGSLFKASINKWQSIRRGYSLQGRTNKDADRTAHIILREKISQAQHDSLTEAATAIYTCTKRGLRGIAAAEHRTGLAIPSRTELPSLPIKDRRSIAADRDRRLRAFKKEHRTSFAAIDDSANIAKADRQRWRKGDYSEKSEMSRRLEDVLAGRLPLLSDDQRPKLKKNR